MTLRQTADEMALIHYHRGKVSSILLILQWRPNEPMASQITNLTIVYLIVYSGTDQRKHQSPASLAFVGGIHRGPVNSPHKRPVTRKMFLFDDVIMRHLCVGLLDHPYMHIVLIAQANSNVKPLQWCYMSVKSPITGNTSVFSIACSSKRSEISMFHITGPYNGKQPVAGGCLAQMANNAESVFSWWRHHAAWWILWFY